MSEPVIVAVDGGVMTLTLNRPDKKNALTNAMYATLGESLVRAESGPSGCGRPFGTSRPPDGHPPPDDACRDYDHRLALESHPAK